MESIHLTTIVRWMDYFYALLYHDIALLFQV